MAFRLAFKVQLRISTFVEQDLKPEQTSARKPAAANIVLLNDENFRLFSIFITKALETQKPGFVSLI